jgi:hypothetical protein
VDQEEQTGRSNQELINLELCKGRGAAAPFFIFASALCAKVPVAGFVAELA